MAGLKERITGDAKRNSCTQIAKQHGLKSESQVARGCSLNLN